MFSLALITTILLARNFLKPIKHILEGSHQLTTGNFAVRMRISSPDELGQLAKYFNPLALTLEKNEHMQRGYMADLSHKLHTPLAYYVVSSKQFRMVSGRFQSQHYILF
ncbi:MAG: HAMP domain-containing protein [Candidatus Phlomobacter fragariae]